MNKLQKLRKITRNPKRKKEKQMDFEDIKDGFERLMDDESPTGKKLKAAMAAGAGGITGGTAVAASGMTAIGMVGSGAGFGAAAGPVGFIAGAFVGLAIYGIKQTLS